MAEDKSVSRTAIWLALIGVYLGWGVIFLANQYALRAFPAFLMNGARNLIAGVILYAFVMLRGVKAPTVKMWKSAFVVSFIMICCGSGLNFWGQSMIPSGISALLIGSTPLWMVILEIIISKRAKTPGPTALAIMGVIIGFAGIVFLIGPGNIVGAHTRLRPLGTVALLIGSFFWSAGSLKSRTAVLPSSRILSAAMLMITGGISLTVAGILMGEPARFSPSNVTFSAIMGFTYGTLVSSVIAFSLYTWLLAVAPITLVSTFAFVNPVVAVILGVIVLKEAFSMHILVASLLILAAVAIVTVASGKKTVVKKP